jgi:hypothetical protein
MNLLNRQASLLIRLFENFLGAFRGALISAIQISDIFLSESSFIRIHFVKIMLNCKKVLNKIMDMD